MSVVPLSLAAGRTVSIIGPNLPPGPVKAVWLSSLAPCFVCRKEAANAHNTAIRTIAATKYFFAFIIPAFSHKAIFRGRRYQTAVETADELRWTQMRGHSVNLTVYFQLASAPTKSAFIRVHLRFQFSSCRVGGTESKRWLSERHESLRRSEEHTSELQSQSNLVCRLLLEKKK